MHSSRCFVASAGELGCRSCHDSHQAIGPEKRVAFYRQACLQCHSKKGCSLPVAKRVQQNPGDNCIDCHMPRYSSTIPHTASTDHRILRGGPTTKDLLVGPPSAEESEFPFLPFRAQALDQNNPELVRNLAIALARELEQGNAAIRPLIPQGLAWSEKALERDSEDGESYRAKSTFLLAQGRTGESLAAVQALLARQPNDELALENAARLAGSLNQLKQAEDYWRQAIEANPYLDGYRGQLGQILARQGAWEEALVQSEACLKLAPAHVSNRVLFIDALRRTGRRKQAQEEFAKFKALYGGEVQRWFPGVGP
jgi:Flp pilus assembly protein TadD